MSVYVKRLFPYFSRNGSVLCRNIKVGSERYGLEGQSVLRCAATVKSPPPKPSSWRRYGKLVGMGFGVGALATGVYMYDIYKRVTTPIANPSEGGEYVLREAPPSFTPSRRIQVPTDTTGLKITLFQYQTCPFCCKVRAFLDYFGFSYDVIEVNSVTRTQTRWTDYRKVPFLVVQIPNTDVILQLKDSTMIISVLQSFLDNNTSNLPDLVKCYPTMVYTDEEGEKRIEIMNRYFLMYGQHPSGRTKEDIVEERKWRKWVDDVFVHVLSPNVYRTTKEAFQAFEWFSKVGDWEEHFATWERLLVVYVGAVAMFLIGKNLKRRHQLKDDVRCSFYEETNVWLKALKKKGTKFMGGDQPNLSDLAVYGILTAVEGCDAFQDLKNNTKITPWFERMKEVVIQHGGATSTGEKGSAA
ncbi:prostaglandin E synthase 2-like isoform X1 [Homarus americanus]|uniref:Prostaglandin E synthase 2-like n=1 Tax=Homarus americanus TaxID=6706 RepID=A0A8J5K8Y2_HOMAM|nr:prostaglandin E synthase 2-like isoform X1 [Homarus americanus]KAG7171256.1 Prostaglandin E synthase 2-like [Homarus americanus]